ncbi:MAG: hypothetical protein CFK49_07460 [Armatimonadetes bacterium JP3_11]|nr:MAG: hypothetical protein CFK48_08055 [Armatimonadetes bacterium CP1_7O]OYT74623.1 MAG: hypothetical protein CFK49_07460 [Armatimonadetes bacterium JP3_11]RMH07856.1 MAG: hypothetical protein D6697_07660 [Armatimonadota bacterium]
MQAAPCPSAHFAQFALLVCLEREPAIGIEQPFAFERVRGCPVRAVLDGFLKVAVAEVIALRVDQMVSPQFREYRDAFGVLTRALFQKR